MGALRAIGVIIIVTSNSKKKKLLQAQNHLQSHQNENITEKMIKKVPRPCKLHVVGYGCAQTDRSVSMLFDLSTGPTSSSVPQTYPQRAVSEALVLARGVY